MAITRRQLLIGTGCAAAASAVGIPVISRLLQKQRESEPLQLRQTPKSREDRILEIFEYALETPRNRIHHAFFEGSRTIELFFPDQHTKGQQKLLSEMVQWVQYALQESQIPVVAGGLEGVTHGFQDKSKLEATIREIEQKRKERRAYVTAHTKFLAKFLHQYNIPPDVLEDALHSLLEAEQVHINIAPAIARAGAPGLSYYNLFPRVYGLEDRATDDQSIRVINYQFSLRARNGFAKALQLEIPQSAEREEFLRIIQEYHDHCNKDLDGASPNISLTDKRDLDRIAKPGHFDKKVFSDKLLTKERTQHWVGAAPPGIEGIVAVIGGLVHLPYYEQIAQEKKQSYVIFAEEEIIKVTQLPQSY